MELLVINPNQSNGTVKMESNSQDNNLSTAKPFIQANTEETSLLEIKQKHIIPVFIKDNEPLISHADFIDATMQVISEVYRGEIILPPNIRVSHPIKGRIPEAKSKPASELEEYEKTIYYERMAFISEVATIYDEINGNTLTLTIGGVKAYNIDNIYNKKGSDEHFKVFVGFKNKVCTNLCVWTDGFCSDIRVSNINSLKAYINAMLENYNAMNHLNSLKRLSEYSLTEAQFAQLIGRCRLYNYLPKKQQADITPMLFGDNQIATVCRDYYKDDSFCRDKYGNINLWKLFNLFTGANKSSYIDQFVERSVNAYQFAEQIQVALENRTNNWFLK